LPARIRFSDNSGKNINGYKKDMCPVGMEIRKLTDRDIPGACELTDRAWSHDYGLAGYIRYGPEVLKGQRARPGSIWLGAYSGDELVGFNAALPVNLSVQRRAIRASIPTYLSVDPGARRKGVAKQLVLETARLARDEGYDIMLPYFDDMGTGKRVYEKCFPSMYSVLTGGWLGRILRPGEFSDAVGYDVPAEALTGGRIRAGLLSPGTGISAFITKALEALVPVRGSERGTRLLSGADASLVRQLTRAGSDPISWEMRWNREELAAELDDPLSVTAGADAGGGLACAVHMKLRTLMSRKPLRFALLDWSYGGRGVRRALGRALAAAVERGAALALVPRMGFIGTASLAVAGFVPYRKSFELCCVPLGEMRPEGVDRVRLVVR